MRLCPASIDRAMVWKTRAAIFVGVWLGHCLATTAVLAVQTSCLDYPCVDALAFDAARALLIFPLFYTPWVDFPAQDVAYVRDLRMIGWFGLNAALSCSLTVVAWVAGRHARAWWVMRKALKRVG
jgi:hypothetical protein